MQQQNIEELGQCLLFLYEQSIPRANVVALLT
jgi:hypothetical protein